MKYKLVIFDFDGTLADSFPWVLGTIDHLADKYRFRRVEKSDLESLRGLSPRKLMHDHGVSLWKMPLIAHSIQTWMAQEIQQIPLFPGIQCLLQLLVQREVQMALVTSNSYANARAVLGAQADLFQFYECRVSMFGKPAKLRKVLQKAGVRPGEALCIGDEIRDIEAANKVKIPFGAVAWGYSQLDALKLFAPTYIFQQVEDISALFQE